MASSSAWYSGVGAEPPTSVKTRPARRGWPALFRSPLFWLGALLLVGLTAFSFGGPLLYRASPYATHVSQFLRPPGRGLPLGADALGRNELARLMVGGQGLILIGLVSALVATLVGTVVGLWAGEQGGAWDRLLMGLADTLLGVPQLVPLLLVDVLLRPSAVTMVVVMAATGWPVVARLVRAKTLGIREREFVASAVAAGANGRRVMFRHVWPNLMSDVLVAASGQVASSVLLLATATFLGLGLPPPTPNWATMMAGSVNRLAGGLWWLAVPAGLAFVLLQISVHFIADAVRSAFDPRLRREVA